MLFFSPKFQLIRILLDNFSKYVYNIYMLMIALIFMFIATTILVVLNCFIQRNNPLSTFIQTLSLIILMCLGFVCANYKNNFSGYSIFLIISVLPLFLNTFNFKDFLDVQKASIKENENSFEIKSTSEQNSQRKEKKHYFINSDGTLINNSSLCISAFLLGLSGLYLGKESVYGFLIGLAISFAATFLYLIIKKEKNPYKILSFLLVFLAVGVLLGQILSVVIYSFNITSIIYCLGSISFITFIFLNRYIKSRFCDIAYFIAMILMFVSIML